MFPQIYVFEKIGEFQKKLQTSSVFGGHNKLKISKFNLTLLFSLILLFSITFFSLSTYISNKNIENRTNLENVANSNEFKKLSNFFLSKINSPYQEIKYTIQNNDSIERILKKYDVKNEDIKNISVKLKQKNLSKLYLHFPS